MLLNSPQIHISDGEQPNKKYKFRTYVYGTAFEYR